MPKQLFTDGQTYQYYSSEPKTYKKIVCLLRLCYFKYFKTEFKSIKRDNRINPEHCYWLSKDYYKDVCKFVRRDSNPESDYTRKQKGQTSDRSDSSRTSAKVSARTERKTNYKAASAESSNSEESSDSEEDSAEYKPARSKKEMGSRRSSKSSAH